MTVAFIALVLSIYFGIFAYRRPTFEKKLFKKIPIIDWINLAVLPVIVYFALVSIAKNILERAFVPIMDFDDVTILSFNILFLMLFTIGNTMHFVGKVLSRYIPVDHTNIVFQVNEVFHDKLSHYTAFLAGYITLYLLCILELNHPSVQASSNSQILGLINIGLLSGVLVTKAVYGWHSKTYYRPISGLNFVLLIIQTSLFAIQDLDYRLYQYNIFFIAFMCAMLVMFVLRKILIITNMKSKKKLKYAAKLVNLHQ